MYDGIITVMFCLTVMNCLGIYLLAWGCTHLAKAVYDLLKARKEQDDEKV
jgi:hypothetical protein